MSRRLDREGIFKARPLEWSVRTSESSQAVGIQCDFQILEALDGDQWQDWSEYEEHFARGTFWVIKSDGGINTSAVEQFAKSTGWNGSLDAVFGLPPKCIVQITVKAETYNDRTTHKVAWINPENFQPAPVGADAGTVKQLTAKYGSLLRAAAGAATATTNGGGKTPTTKPAPPRAAAPKPVAVAVDASEPHPTPADDSDIPF